MQNATPNSTGYHSMRLVESSTEQVEYSTRNYNSDPNVAFYIRGPLKIMGNFDSE